MNIKKDEYMYYLISSREARGFFSASGGLPEVRDEISQLYPLGPSPLAAGISPPAPEAELLCTPWCRLTIPRLSMILDASRGKDGPMEFQLIEKNGVTLAEVVGDDICLRTVDDALDLMVSADVPILIMRVCQINADFFRLPTGLLGEVLQKFTNYRVKLAVVGDLSPYMTDNFSDFIRESNRGGKFLFVSTREEAIEAFTGSS